ELLPILIATDNDLHNSYNIQRLALRLKIHLISLMERANSMIKTLRNNEIPKLQGYLPKSLPNSETESKSQAKPEAEATSVSDSSSSKIEEAQTNAMERYCLSMLLRNTRLWSQANRKLREAAPKHGPALDALSGEDFTHSDYRAI